MVLYSLIMFLTAAPMIKISAAIYHGNTGLIHHYHQTNVSDKAAYGKAFGKAMFAISASLLLSGIVGIIGLFGKAELAAKIAVAVLFIGLFMGTVRIIAVQKKYNKGIF